MAAVLDRGGWSNLFRPKTHRYWELCGCMTAGASENQFYNATGWWRHPKSHPKCRGSWERARREKLFWEHGTGIWYWVHNYSGRVVTIDPRLVEEGHCSIVGKKNFQVVDKNRNSPQFAMWTDLNTNYSLPEIARKLKIEHLL